MTKEEIKRIDDQGIAAWDKHDAKAFVNLLSDRFVWHDWTMREPMRDKEAARQYFTGWITAFPDLKVKQTMRVIGDDAVAAELEFTGTNNGPLIMGGKQMPATNKAVVAHGSYIARVDDGKIVEFRTHPDVAGLMMQLGMMPAM